MHFLERNFLIYLISQVFFCLDSFKFSGLLCTYFSKLLRSFFKHRQFMSGWRTIFRYVKDIWVKLCRTIAYLHKIYTNVFTIQFQFIRIRSGRSILIFLKLEKNQIGLLYIFHCISFIFIFLTSLIIEQRKKLRYVYGKFYKS